MWMYWETLPGERKPPYLDVCLETIKANLDDDMLLHELDQETVFSWLPDCSPIIWQRLGNPVRRSDYARVRLIERYGGTWIDADTVLMMPLRIFVEPLARDSVVSAERFSLGMFAARPNAPLIRTWRRTQDEVLASSGDWTTLPWAALGSDSLCEHLDHFDYYRFPRERMVPIEWYEWRRLLSRLEPPAAIMQSSPISVFLFNGTMSGPLANMTRADILSDNMLLSRLLRLALGISTLSDETKASMCLAPVSRLRVTKLGRHVEEGLRSILRTR